MDFTRFFEKIMLMNDERWKRHSNPWSVYTRFTILPLISLAFYSRMWITYYCLIPIIMSFIWIWLNPRVFPIPKKTYNWASMGTFGERIYLKRKINAIPKHHVLPAIILQIMAGLALPVFIYALYSLNVWALVLSNIWIMIFKACFVHRMVYLYKEMKDNNH